jgi:hypothetical protein
MDPVTIGAVLLAIVSGAAGEAGSELWDGLITLVRRPFRHREAPGEAPVPVGSGTVEAELRALVHAPDDQGRAVAVAEALLARADADVGFRRDLENWWGRAGLVHTGEGNVTNAITGGTQRGPVLQGRDFTGLTFGSPTPPPTRE